MSDALFRFARGSRGSVLTTFAVALPVLLGAGAFGVDAGVLFLERRALQKAADAATLAAAADLDAAAAAARRMLAANGQGDARFTLGFGRYRDDPTLARDERFAPAATPAAATNAVSIEATRSVPTLFARIFGQRSATIGVRSQAAVTPVVSFAIGSRLASADPPVVNALLAPLLGAPLGLDLVDYRALARSQIRVGVLLRSLAAAGGLAPEATAGAVLRRPVLLSAVLSVTAAELNGTGDPSGAAVLRKAARNTVGLALEVAPGDLLGLDSAVEDLRLDYPGDALGARISVLSLLSAAVTDRSIGNEVAASLALPGLVRADVGLLLGEAERRARSAVVGRVGANGPSAATAQARLRIGLRVGAGAVFPGLEADVPFELVAAGARATILSASCSPDPAKREVRVAVYPGLARLSLGRSEKGLRDMTVDDAVRPATIAASRDARIDATGSLVLERTTPAFAVFRGAEIGDGTVKTVRTRNLVESLVTTLIDEAKIDVRLEALGLTLGSPELVKRTARALLVTLAQPADALLDGALAAAGIGLGEADVRVDTLVCGHARLVG